MAINLSGTFEHNGKNYSYAIEVREQTVDSHLDSLYIDITDEEGNKYAASWFYKDAIVEKAKASIDARLHMNESFRSAKR
ncbi:hypothetical protein BH11BAC1_BH11BAC1_29810 [soil metagenome]